jgi:hypothetical protein
MLARMHDRGEGVPVTPKEAFHYYRLGALDDNRECLVEVCDAYLRGAGVERDPEQAQFWLKRLTDRGDFRAIFRSGDLLLAQRKWAEALQLWTRVGNMANTTIAAYGWERLSRIYTYGLGVPVDKERGEAFFQDALRAGNIDALCRHGRRLVADKRVGEAREVLQTTADQGSDEAMFLLGFMHYSAQGGPRNYPMALALFRRSAGLGYTDAMVALGVCTLQNVPDAPSVEEALHLAETAEAAGHPKAAELRHKLEARLKREQEQTAPQPDSAQARPT